MPPLVFAPDPARVSPSMVDRVLAYKTTSALNEAGGFLTGYTHTGSPAIGCPFARFFCGVHCYARYLTAWRTTGRIVLGAEWEEGKVLIKEGYAEAFEAELARSARRSSDNSNHLSKLRIYYSPLTEPCASPSLETTRQVLRVLAKYPVARFVLQTRSPSIMSLRDELKALPHGMLIISFSLESDDDEAVVFDPPVRPTIRARRRTIEKLAALGLPVCATVSPANQMLDVPRFADWIAKTCVFAIVDTMISGDGSPQGHGARTAKTRTPDLYAEKGMNWRDETHARQLFEALQSRMGERVGWAQPGFVNVPVRQHNTACAPLVLPT